MTDALISVLIPVYNAEKFIVEAIDSILNQTYLNIEVLIGDSSDDKTSELIKTFKDSRIKYFYLKNYSIAQALNFLLDKSNGEFIARMDADDISDLRRFEIQLEFLNKNRDIDIVGSNFYYISESGKLLFEKKMPEFHNQIEYAMPIEASILHPTILCRKSIYTKIGVYNTNYQAEDFEFLLRALSSNCKMYNIQIPLLYYRVVKRERGKIILQNNCRLSLGRIYIENCYKNFSDNNSLFLKFYRIALLEYYSGSLVTARKYLLKCFKLKPSEVKKILRYFLVSLLGDRFIHFLRDKNILLRFNHWINRTLKYDFKKIHN